MQWFLMCLLVVAGLGRLQADIATEGEVDVKVQLMNGDSFKGFTFYIRYQNYTYNMGYQPSGITEVTLKPGDHVETGGRGDASLLYARDKNGKEYVSKVEVGGVAQGQSSDVSYILHQIEVSSVKKGVIKFKVVSQQKIGAAGKVLEVMQGAVSFDWTMVVLPIACLLGLVAFFFFRRQRPGKSVAA